MKTKEEILKDKRDLKDEARGIYFLIKGSEIVYIGKSESNIFDRISVHNKNKDFDEYSYELIDDKDINLDKIESDYIAKFTPKYNKIISDFENYEQVANLSKMGIEPINNSIKLNVFCINDRLYINKTELEEKLYQG